MEGLRYRKSGHVVSDLSMKYLDMLAKHFARKVEVEQLSESEPVKALVNFPMGTCLMTAQGSTLSFEIEAGSEQAASGAASIISGHMHLLKKLENKDIEWVSSIEK